MILKNESFLICLQRTSQIPSTYCPANLIFSLRKTKEIMSSYKKLDSYLINLEFYVKVHMFLMIFFIQKFLKTIKKYFFKSFN